MLFLCIIIFCASFALLYLISGPVSCYHVVYDKFCTVVCTFSFELLLA